MHNFLLQILHPQWRVSSLYMTLVYVPMRNIQRHERATGYGRTVVNMLPLKSIDGAVMAHKTSII